MVSVSPTTVKSMKEVLWREKQPLGAVNTLIRDLKNGLKVQKIVAQKDFLEVCVRKQVYPKDVISIAKSLARGDDRKLKSESRRIMRDRITEKARDIRISRDSWNSSTSFCRRNIRLSDEGWRIIKSLRKMELDSFWKQTVDRLKIVGEVRGRFAP